MRPAADDPHDTLPERLEDWVAAGLVSPEQARAIREHEALAPGRAVVVPPGPGVTPPAGTSLVVEALGYLGGSIMVVGAIILVNIYWLDMSTVVRLLLTGATAVALVVAGLFVPDRYGDAAARLRSVLWALAVAATTAFMVIFSDEVVDRQDEASLIVVGPCTAVVAGLLWWFRRTWLQQVALLVPLVLTSAGLAYAVGGLDTAWSGGFAWLLAVVWTALAWAGWLEPRVVGVALGGLVATFGASGIDSDLGIVLGLVTAVMLVVLALHERSLPWLAVAAVSVLRSAPRAAVEWFPGRLSAALTLMVTGGLLVLAAVWVARHQGEAPRPRRRPGNATGGRPHGRPPAREA